MSWLPDAHGRSVRLHLVNIPPFNPHGLALHDGLLNDRRRLNHDRLGDHGGLLNHDRLGHYCRRGLDYNCLGIIRTRQGCPYDTADHSADESRPEVPTARPPAPAVVVMMISSVPTTVVISAVPTSTMSVRERPCRYRREGNCQYEFLHCLCLSGLSPLQRGRKSYLQNLTKSFPIPFAAIMAFSKFSSNLANVSYSVRPDIAF